MVRISSFDYLMHFYLPIRRKRRWRYALEKFSSAEELTIFQVFRLVFDFLSRKFSAWSKPPSRDNHR